MPTYATHGSAHSAIVAGAGIIGLATAWKLVKQGWNVTVYDGAPVSGSTFAAAGMLAPVSEVTWDQPHLYPLMVASQKRYPDFVAAVENETGTDTDYLESGTLVLAGDTADRDTLNELMDLQHAMGMHIEQITPSTARHLEPAIGPGLAGAVQIPEDNQIDPRKFCAALIKSLGSRVVQRNVTALTWTDGRVVGVVLDDDTVAFADMTILATGIPATGIANMPEGLVLPMRPVYGDIIRMRIPDHMRPLLTRTVRGWVQSRPVYFVPRSDGTLVVGASSREDDMDGTSAQGVYDVLRDAHRLIPSVLDCEIYEITTRARPGSPDDVPMIGNAAPGLVISTGYFRHGILLSAIGSDLTVSCVVDGFIDPEFEEQVDLFRFSDPSVKQHALDSLVGKATMHPAAPTPSNEPIIGNFATRSATITEH